MISRGTRITFVVQGSTGEFLPRTADDIQSAAIDYINRFATVESIGIVRDPGNLIREWWDYGYTANVRIVTRYDHASINDLIGIVRDAFARWQAAGETPTVTAQGYTPGPISGEIGGTKTPPSTFGLGLGAFGLLAIAVAIATWKNT